MSTSIRYKLAATAVSAFALGVGGFTAVAVVGGHAPAGLLGTVASTTDATAPATTAPSMATGVATSPATTTTVQQVAPAPAVTSTAAATPTAASTAAAPAAVTSAPAPAAPTTATTTPTTATIPATTAAVPTPAAAPTAMARIDPGPPTVATSAKCRTPDGAFLLECAPPKTAATASSPTR